MKKWIVATLPTLLILTLFSLSEVTASLGTPGSWGDPCRNLNGFDDANAYAYADPEKAFEIGNRYFTPPGFPNSRGWKECPITDLQKAAYWFEIAAQANHVGAAGLLGGIYKEGVGVARDLQKSEAWYEKAAMQGDISAILKMAEIYFDGLYGKTDYKKAKTWLEKATAQGSHLAEMRLSEMYEKGLGVAQDSQKAIQWLQLAVQHRSREAHYELGKRMLEGRGVPKDHEKGISLIQTAAQAHSPRASFYLGLAYRDGKGMKADKKQAKHYLAQALTGAVGVEDITLIKKILSEVVSPNSYLTRPIFLPNPNMLANILNGSMKSPGMEQVPALALAVELRNPEIVSLLLKKGADPNGKRTISQRSALWLAAEFGQVELIKILLKHGADMNARSAKFHASPSHTPLEIAYENGHTHVVKFLQSLGAKGLLTQKREPTLDSVAKKSIEYRSLEGNDEQQGRQTRVAPIHTPAPDYLEELISQDAPKSISNWMESEKARYRSLLLSQSYDVLVVPMQVQRFAIDQVGRSLMSAYLVDYLRSVGQLRIPDPTFVAKALGDNARTYDKKLVYKLANELNVHTIVWGFVGHDRISDMRYTLQVQRKEQSDFHEFTPILQWDSDVHYFWDEAPPESLFSELLPTIAHRIVPDRFTHTHVEPPQILKKKEWKLPVAPLDLVRPHNSSQAQSAYELQLLGALFPIETERERERVFERSLVALSRMNPEDPEVPLLKARALFYLHRRPAALQVLKAPQNPSEKAMLAVLNGNLPELEQQILNIQSPIKQLLAFFDLVDLRHLYKKIPAIPKGRKILAHLPPQWSQMIQWRLHDLDKWSVVSNLEVKKSLDRHFPVQGFTLDDIQTSHAVRKNTGTHPLSNKIELSVVSHVRKLMKQNPARWCCLSDLGQPQPWDLLNLFASRGEANIIKSIAHYVGIQGTPKVAKNLLDQYSSVYSGHPALTELKGRVLLEQINKEDPENRRNLQQQYEQEVYQAVMWAGGQSRSAASALENSTKTVSIYRQAQLKFEHPYPDMFPLYSHDVPHRPYWPIFATRHRVMDSRYHENIGLSLDYTHHDLWYLEMEHGESTQEKVKTLLDSNAHRFIGHPRRISFLAKAKQELGDKNGAIQLYQTAIDNGETGWDSYWNLGGFHLKKGQYEEASNVFWKFPGFHQKNAENTVERSNNASNAGAVLFWRGAYSRAIPFFETSINFQTQAENEFISATRLALLKGDYLAAAQFVRHRAKYYDNKHAYGDYFTFLHLLGFTEQAWKGFLALAQDYSSPEMWNSVFIGHRLQGTSKEDLDAWIERQHQKHHTDDQLSMAGRLAFMAYAIDRLPDQSMIDLVTKLEKGYESKILSPHVVNNKKNEKVGPSTYNNSQNVSLKIGSTPDAELVYFAKAYLALRQKDYTTAVKWFEEKARFYSYRYGKGSYALPYFAWATAKNGDTKELEALLDNYENPDQLSAFGYKKGFEWSLAKALLAGGQGHHKEAITLLHQAFNHDHYDRWQPVSTWYQIVEACEWLFEDSGRSKYRELALQWSKTYQVIQPMFAWAYAVEAKYTKDEKAKRRALAFALHLDQHSERLKGISEEEKKQARMWFQENNPYRLNLIQYKAKQIKS